MTWARLETKSWPSTVDAEVAERGDFFQEGDGVEDDAVADDAFAAGAQDAAGDELEDEFLPADG